WREAALPRHRETVHSARLPPPAPARPLADHNVDRALFTSAHDGEAHLPPDRIATQHIEQLIEALETLAVDRHDDIAQEQSGVRRGGVLLDRHEQQAATLIGTNRLHGGADPAARDVAALEELGYDAVYRADRNRGRQGTTQRSGVDAMDLSARVDQRTAAETGVDREVRLQPAIDLAAFPGAPFAAGRADGTECGARATLVETPQCENEIAGTEHCRIAELGDAE